MAIAQTVAAWAAWKHTTHERALYRLAPHVTGAKPALLRRHAVYGSLPAHGAAKPDAWDDARDGSWAVHGPRWARFRDAVIRLARDGFEPVLDGAPVAWGCEADDKIAHSRGLVRLASVGTVNRFWALPSRGTVSASVASGREGR